MINNLISPLIALRSHVRRCRRSALMSTFALLTSAYLPTGLQQWVVCFKITIDLHPSVFFCKARGKEDVGSGAAAPFGNLNHENIVSSIKKAGGQSNTLRHGLFIMDMSPPLIRSSDHIKWYNCDNADTIVNSSPFLRFERRVNDN